MTTIAQRLLLTRRDLDMNQEELARLCDVSRAYISSLERGRVTNPTIDVVEALAKALGVSPCWLVGWTDVEVEASEEDPGKVTAEDRLILALDADTEEKRRELRRFVDVYLGLDGEGQRLARLLITQVGSYKKLDQVD